MKPRRFLILFVLICLLMFGLWLPASAAPSLQQYLTPTPGADGRILYVVKPGDNCFVVAALHNITVEQLRQLNSRLDENCTLVEAEELLIGVVSPATSTPEAVTSLGTPTITPTPLSGTTEVCVLLYDDINGNSVREETEVAVAGGAVSLTEINGAYSGSQETIIPSDPLIYQGICFTDIPEGTYNISVAIPENYNATTSLDSSLEVNAGDRAFVPFGIQSQDVVVETIDDNQEGGNSQSTLLGIIGGILLLGGVGLGYYAYRTSRPESKLSGGGYLRK